jgi:hypothetical protein
MPRESLFLDFILLTINRPVRWGVKLGLLAV